MLLSAIKRYQMLLNASESKLFLYISFCLLISSIVLIWIIIQIHIAIIGRNSYQMFFNAS